MPTRRIYEFGQFRLDAKERLLVRDGNVLPLTPRLFDTLLLLVENSGHLLLKDELMKSLWPDSFVEETNLTQSISRLRKLLGEAPGQQYIATIAGQGYRFIADVREIPDGGNAPQTLVIESHARESVVFEEKYEDDEAGKPVVVPALPAGRKVRPVYWVIPLAFAAAALVWFALPPKPLVLLASTQTTNDGHLKWQKYQGWEGPLLLTDGSRVFMVEDGHKGQTLVQVPVAGGETVPVPVPVPFKRFQLTDIDRQHSELLMLDWSGKAVALEGRLWAYSVVNGGYRRVGDLSVSDAIWAPDGRILFTRGEGLWSADSNGFEEHLLVNLPGLPHAPRTSPDGRVIRFTLADPQTHSKSLWEVSRDGKNPHPLLRGWNNSPAECCGTWTRDGRYYVFQSLREGKWGIWALRERGWFWKTAGPFKLTTGPMDYVSPMISPDGKQLFAVGMQSRNEMLRFDSQKNQFVPFLPELSATALTFSKDGKWVAYTSDVDGQLWRANADGSNRQRLTSGPSIVFMPAWSPDGKWIAFVAGPRGESYVRTWKLYVVPAEGGPATDLLPESPGQFDPSWSPDGNMLAFAPLPGGPVPTSVEGLGSQNAIFTVDLETRKVAKIPGSDGLFSPHWSPRGQLAALTAGLKRLVLYDATKQTWGELVDDKAAFPRWSHDDKYIYFDPPGPNGFVCRVDVKSRKVERIASLDNLRTGGTLGAWSGLTPDDIPLFTRDAGSEEIYAFDLELP